MATLPLNASSVRCRELNGAGLALPCTFPPLTFVTTVGCLASCLSSESRFQKDLTSEPRNMATWKASSREVNNGTSKSTFSLALARASAISRSLTGCYGPRGCWSTVPLFARFYLASLHVLRDLLGGAQVFSCSTTGVSRAASPLAQRSILRDL